MALGHFGRFVKFIFFFLSHVIQHRVKFFQIVCYISTLRCLLGINCVWSLHELTCSKNLSTGGNEHVLNCSCMWRLACNTLQHTAICCNTLQHVLNSTGAKISRSWSILDILGLLAFSVSLFCHSFE